MSEEFNLETYLCILENKFEIYLFDKIKSQILYKNEIIINNYFLDFRNLNLFLDENIIKIEKLIGKFIKNIFIIIDNDKIFQLNMGIRKKNYDKKISIDILKSLLLESKDIFQKNYQDYKILHIIVSNYFIDGKNLNYFKSSASAEDLGLVINFISIPVSFSNKLERQLEKYQIKINKYLSKRYIDEFFKNQEIIFPAMVYKILTGSNDNEVHLTPKFQKNEGFFEKFFKLFS